VSGKEHALKVKACKESTAGELFVIAGPEAFIAGYSIEDALDRADPTRSGADAVADPIQERPDQIIELAKAMDANDAAGGRADHV